MEYGRIPRDYNFIINGHAFKIFIQPWDDKNLHPKDILARELEECVSQLRGMNDLLPEEEKSLESKPFKLPPLNPNADSNQGEEV